MTFECGDAWQSNWRFSIFLQADPHRERSPRMRHHLKPSSETPPLQSPQGQVLLGALWLGYVNTSATISASHPRISPARLNRVCFLSSRPPASRLGAAPPRCECCFGPTTQWLTETKPCGSDKRADARPARVNAGSDTMSSTSSTAPASACVSASHNRTEQNSSEQALCLHALAL